MENTEPRPGDLFQQNRRNRRPPSNNHNNNHNNHNANDTNYNRNHNTHSNYRSNNHSHNPRSFQHSRRSSSKPNLQNLPMEHGRIHTLLNNFGFIYCADRPMDLFFHYSELNSKTMRADQDVITVDDLKVGDEVQFYIGPSRTNHRGGSGGEYDGRSGSGSGGEEKLSAYSVTVLEHGTVQWETEVEPNSRKLGYVERMIRYPNLSHRDSRDRDGSGHGGGSQEGTIRLCMEEEQEETTEDCHKGKDANESENADTDANADPNANDKEKDNQQEKKPKRNPRKGQLVRYTAKDYEGYQTQSHNPHHRSSRGGGGGGSRNDIHTNALERKDLVEFTLVQCNRSKFLYARNISLIQSERDRLEEERERVLLENATLEQGVVVSLKNGFGFLRSNRRREQVYFHFGHILLPDDDDDDDDEEEEDANEEENDGVGGDNGDRRERQDDHTLQEGQDMEFLVVHESDNHGGHRDRDRGGKKRLGARQVRFLPKGSVVFEQVVATGVTGVLDVAPRFMNVGLNSGGRRGHGHGHGGGNKNVREDAPGQVLLSKPIQFDPTGSESNPDQSGSMEVNQVSLYASDCRGFLKDEPRAELWFKVGDTLLFDIRRDLVDGICRVAPTKCITPDDPSQQSTDTDTVAKIRLVSPTLTGRAEGVVSSIKDNYGFLQLAHRNVDVYFRLNEIFPPFIQQDILSNDSESANAMPNDLPTLSVGSEVTFDLSLPPPKSRPNRSNHGRYGRRGGEKEQLRAQRLLLLPPGTLTLKKEFETTGVVTRVLRNSFTGNVRLHKKVKAMAQREQYPLITKVISDFNSDKSKLTLNFPDVQSEYENDIITEIVRGYQNLEVHFIPSPEFGEDNRGRISIGRVKRRKESIALDPKITEDADVPELTSDIMDDNVSDNAVNVSGDPEVNVSGDFDTSQEVDLVSDDDAEVADIDEHGESEDEKAQQTLDLQKQQKNTRRKTRTIKSISFDRQSLAKDFITDPPINGDKVTMTIIFSRSTEKFSVSNMTLLERNEPIVKAIKYNLCEGFVLLEPKHTTFKGGKSKRRGFEGGGWGSDEKDEEDEKKSNDDGILLLLTDPGDLYKSNNADASEMVKPLVQEEGESNELENPPSIGNLNETVKDEISEVQMDLATVVPETSHLGQNISYTIASIGSRNSADIPKRGDLVTFVKGKNGKAKDVRVITKNSAKKLKGKLAELNVDTGTAVFHSLEDGSNKTYEVDLKEVVSCEIKMLKQGVDVEGILHEEKVVGICRNADLYLETSITGNMRHRPKLNLSVKKELKGLGGKIIAQSCMAKGPDNTCGFYPGWTSRKSMYEILPEDAKVVENLDTVDPGDEDNGNGASSEDDGNAAGAESDVQPSLTTLNVDAEPFVL